MQATAHENATHWKSVPVHVGSLLTLALVPVWYRLPAVPLLADLYVSRFLLLIPMLWTIGVWLAVGLPGFAALRHDRRRLWALALLTLALWSCASTGWAFMRSTHPEVSTTSAVQTAIVALFCVVIASHPPPPRLMIAVFATGLIWNSLLTYAQATSQHHLGLQALGEFPVTPDRTGASVLLAADLRWLRPYGLLPHPNLLAGFLTVALLITSSGLLMPQRNLQLATTGMLWIGFLALLLTFSRGAWLGFGVAGLLLLMRLLPNILGHPELRRHLALAGLGILLVTAGFAVRFWPLLAARSGVGEERVELRSIADRVVFLQLAERTIRENPLRGVGSGNFPWRSAYYLAETDYDLRGDNVHNVYLLIWSELGLVGLVLFALVLISAVAAVVPVLRLTVDVGISSFLVACFVVLATIGLVDHYPWSLLHFKTLLTGCLALALGYTYAGQPTKHSL